MDTPADTLSVHRAAELTAQEASQQWLIEGLWASAGVGLIGGAPKSCKSWLGLEMAVSVAAKKPCLGAYATRSQGKVLLYMAEDATSVVRSRFDALSGHHGVPLKVLDLFVITENSLRLDLASHQRRLRETVAQIRPSMLLLDPLVRLHRIDENSASEVSALLAFLRSLQREFQTAVVLVHHTRKNGSVNQPGQALRGSGDLHAFGDSNLYLKRHRQQLLLTVEHRAAPSPQPIELRLVGGDTPHLEIVESSTPEAGELNQAVCELLRLQGPMTRASLRKTLRVRNQRLGKTLSWLQDNGDIQRCANGWRVAENIDGEPPEQHIEETCDANPASSQQTFRFPLIGVHGNGTNVGAL